MYQPTAGTMRMAPTKAHTVVAALCEAQIRAGTYVSKAPIYHARRPLSARSGEMRRLSHQACDLTGGAI